MKQTLQNIPFLRITIALAIGVVSGTYFHLNPTLIFVSIGVLLIGLFLINKNYRYSYNIYFGLGIQLFFVLLGIILTRQHNEKPVLFDKGNFIAIVLETPQEKQNSYKSILQIEAVSFSDSILATNETVIAYFAKSDSVGELKAGDIILFDKPPQSIENNNNPFEFDYKDYLGKKLIFRQVYLPAGNWLKTGQAKKSITIWAEKTREKLLQIYRNQPIDETEFEILSALTLGYKRELEPETKRIFSASGASHVLAVSGLHVGVVFYLINLLFGFLRKIKKSRLLFMLISISTLWIYAFITGLSPSVMRAATMFSIFTIGENLNRRSNIYNLLAASACFLLLINPNNLFDIGCQLSYSAVFGIVFLQPKLEKMIYVKNKILKYFWVLVTVSFAAQIATFPITSYYFGQFPTYFWLTNSFVIPAVMVLIPLGIFLLFASAIPVISTILAFLLNYILKITYFLLSLIYELPFSVFNISLDPYQFVLLISSVAFVFVFLKNQNIFYLKTTLFSILFIFLLAFVTNLYQLNQTEMIVYNSGKNTAVQLIHGKTNYIVLNEELTNDEKWFHPGNITSRALGLKTPVFVELNDSISNEYLLMKNRLLIFEGKSISLHQKLNEFKKDKLPDFIINPAFSDPIYIDPKENTIIVTNKSFLTKKFPSSVEIHNTTIKGAFRKKW